MYKQFILMLLILVQSLANATDECTKEYLVFDVGSSLTKGIFYVKNVCTNIILKRQTFNQQFPYQSCISQSQSKTLSNDCMSGGMQAMQAVKDHFKIDCAYDNCFALTTGWSRYINNYDEWQNTTKKLGITSYQASQNYEGDLKLRAIQHETNNSAFIAFDIGGGSFQLTWIDDNQQVYHYNSAYGTDNFAYNIHNDLFTEQAKMCINMQNEQNFKKNQYVTKLISQDSLSCKKYPITFDKTQLQVALNYAHNHIGEPILRNEALQHFIKQHNPTIYADTHLLHFGIKNQLDGFTKGNTVTIDKIYDIIESIAGMSVLEIKAKYPKLLDEYINSTQPAMIILYTIMQSLGVKEMVAVQTEYMDEFLNECIAKVFSSSSN